MANETILVIDDSPTILKVVQLVLTKAGYKIITATDGDEGLELAKSHRPDVILLDFVMPKINGYQFCQVLHKEQALKEIPIILMSAKGDQVGDRFIKVMGIVDYITKPFSPEAIIGIVQHTIEKYRGNQVVNEAQEPSSEEESISTAEAAEAAITARIGGLNRLRQGLCKTISESILACAKDISIALDINEVKRWILNGLNLETLEILLGELRTTAQEFAGDDRTALAGDLRAIPLAEVLLLLGQQEQTGLLIVTRQSMQVELHFNVGKIDLGTAVGVPKELRLSRFILENNLIPPEELEQFFQDRSEPSALIGTQLVKLGHLNHDELREAIRIQTCELVYEMLRWNFGKFTFHTTEEVSPLACDTALDLSVDGILMEGFRRVDEWHLIEREIDNFDLVFVRNEDAVNRMGRGRLTREELAILELVNGKNTIKEIVRLSRMGSFDVSKMLFRLYSIRLIRKRVQPVAV